MPPMKKRWAGLLFYGILFYSHFPLPCGDEENTAPIPTPERRNKMKKQILAALTLLLLLLSACHREGLQKQTDPSPKETQQSEDAPQPEDNGITVTEDVSSGEEKAQDGTLLLRYSLSSPQVLYQGEPMMNIGSYYDNNKEKSLLSITEVLLPMARQRQQDGDFLGNFQWDEEFAIMRNKGSYLSIRRDRSQYTGGVHVQGATAMVVSRGLGNSEFPLRLNNRPEIVKLILSHEE